MASFTFNLVLQINTHFLCLQSKIKPRKYQNPGALWAMRNFQDNGWRCFETVQEHQLISAKQLGHSRGHEQDMSQKDGVLAFIVWTRAIT